MTVREQHLQQESSSRVEPTKHGASPGGMFRRIAVVILERYAALLLLIIAVAYFSATQPQFLTARNLTSLLAVQAIVACIALATLLPLIVGEFDLSLGYALGTISMLGAYLGGQGAGLGVVLVAMVATGILVGLVNGFLVIRFGISSFIATLGTGIVLSGVTQGLSGGRVLFEGIPSFITAVGQNKALGLSISVWAAGLIGLILLVILERTPFGRTLYAVGASERVTYLAGVPTKRLKLLSFVGAGLIVSFAAVFQLGQVGAASTTVGPDLLLPAYAAAFLGVTVFRPGYYNVLGTIVAILLLAVGFNGLSLAGVPFWVQPIFNGGVLLLAVLTARAEARRVRMG
jgi:ribose transport system permease protein